jgi:hypothetical protein
LPVLIILGVLLLLFIEWLLDVLLVIYFFLIWFFFFTWIGRLILIWLRQFKGKIPLVGSITVTAANGPGCIGTDGAYDSGSMAV